MKVVSTWQQGMQFESEVRSHKFLADAKPPIGRDSAASPKEFLLAAICGCTGMDVISLLKKARITPSFFQVNAEGQLTEGAHPRTFPRIDLRYEAKGSFEAAPFIDAISKSMTQYCGVSAMVSKACPIHYEIYLNEALVGTGLAKFD